MKLADLLTADAVADARFAALDLAGVNADSRAIKPGDLFVAVAGAKDDGLNFVSQALASGAAAIMAERPPATPLPKASHSSRLMTRAGLWRSRRRSSFHASRR